MSFRDYLDEELIDSKETDGKQVRYNCPFCPPNSDYKFYVNTTGTKRDGLWDCKKCGSVGNPASFVMKYNKVDFKTAKDILELYDLTDNDFMQEAKDKGLSIEEYLIMYMREQEKPEEEQEKVKLVPPPLPIGYKRIIDNLQNPEVKPYVEYLVNKRGYSPEDIFTHNIGYITDGYAISSTGGKIPLNHHVVFLSHDDNGNYQYWNTRSIEPNPKIKSFNGLSQEGEYSKRTVIFNLNRARNCKKIVIVEGVTDALTVGESGIATFGKQVTEDQVNLLLEAVTEEQEIYIMLDRDADTQAAKLADKLWVKHRKTYIVINHLDKDANDMGRELTWEIIEKDSVEASPENIALLFLP